MTKTLPSDTVAITKGAFQGSSAGETSVTTLAGGCLGDMEGAFDGGDSADDGPVGEVKECTLSLRAHDGKAVLGGQSRSMEGSRVFGAPNRGDGAAEGDTDGAVECSSSWQN